MNTTTTQGHIIDIPAHLIPNMFDDWGMDTIHDVTPPACGPVTPNCLAVNGYSYNDDGEISSIDWITDNTVKSFTEDINPDETLTVWVPTIPPQLADELA